MGERATGYDVLLSNRVWISICLYKLTKMSFREYVGNDEATRDNFAGKWLRTGDSLKVDENNNFWVTDRLKEVGEYIYPC